MAQRALSLQVKVTLAIVLSLLIIDGVGAAIAEYNFRDSESKHAREESTTHVQAISRVLDVRFHTLGQAAADAAESLGSRSPDDIHAGLIRSGFVADVAVHQGDDVLWQDGAASTNGSLSKLLVSVIPPPEFQGRTFLVRDGWLIVSVRSTGHQYAVVGAIDQDTLSNTFLNDVIIDADSSNVIVTRDGRLVASSPNFNVRSFNDLLQLADEEVDSLDDGRYLVQREKLDEIQGYVVHVVPWSSIDARVDALVHRFVATSTAAVVLAGLATVFIVSFAMRPLRRITEAARRLGRGEEELGLKVHTRDELGDLADVLNWSAHAVGDARRAQDAHVEELRLAAEDFQVAVGALARSVGEADTAPEVAKRLADATLLVVPARAVGIFIGPALLEVRIRNGEASLDDNAIRALVSSDPDAFTWFTKRSEEEHLRIAVLASEELREGDGRKIEILLNQATLAFHRARAMDGLRQAHSELDLLLRQKQVYMDILSHDLKNPLAVARGRIEMLAVKHVELVEKIAPIEQSLDRVTKIIDEAVLYSKLDRQTDVERPLADIAPLAQDAVHSLSPLAAQRGIELMCSTPASVPWRANHILVRAIENLLSNAIKWSPERSTVAVIVEPDEDACRIRVVDHGPGIPLEDRPRLFARFERADKTGIKGTGLGLAIAKRVVDMHDGTIRIEDTPGGGCTFVIDLPRSLEQLPPSHSPTPLLKGGSA
ncbi:MAG: ATP-binding protein [Candidatus Thermoplasmatota archaeon]